MEDRRWSLSSILYSRSSILDPPFSILHSRSSILDPLFSILYSRSSILDPLFSILYSRSSILDPLFSILHPRSSILDHFIFSSLSASLYRSPEPRAWAGTHKPPTSRPASP